MLVSNKVNLFTVVITTILTSFYLFPFEFSFLPGANTKLVMAIISLLILAFSSARNQRSVIRREVVILFVFSAIVSLATLSSVIINGTCDYTYVTYFVSILVWTGGAYTLVKWIQFIHSRATVPIVIYYMVAACILQCLAAICISRIPMFDSFVSLFYNDYSSLKNFADGRMYGIGCCFDVAGAKFSAILIMMGVFFKPYFTKHKDDFLLPTLYVVAFFIIAVIGNMISRTTTIGLLISLIYIMFSFRRVFVSVSLKQTAATKAIIVSLLLLLASVILLYRYNTQFRTDFTFAFEGFFNYFNEGELETNSTNVLKTMYRFPDNIKTWIIGDGYFYDTRLDPFYVGKEYKAYYMSTDVGYVRFIYYSGLIGLSAILLFFISVAVSCMKLHPYMRSLFTMFLMLQIIIWLKVASDIFVVFAPFVLLKGGENIDSYLSDDEFS